MVEPAVPEPRPADAPDGVPQATAARTADPIVRGFLFADLRDYTAFVEQAGDAAAADLLSRYRMLVRSVVASHDGAEIRTEGDSFYVVFPSPSAAVRAGLAIVAAASGDAVDHPTDPIQVGVGIHAGESTETAEGYVGSAVNLAARICSVARTGEVLVSDTVRVLTRTRLTATFTNRGRKVLKGVAEPVELWLVEPAPRSAASHARARPRPVSRRARAGLIALGAGVVVIALVGIAALAGDPAGAVDPSASAGTSGRAPGGSGVSPSQGAAGAPASGASASAGPAAFGSGPLDAGTYRTTTFTPGLSLTVPDGWTKLYEIPNALMLGLEADPMRARHDEIPASEIGSRLTIMRPTIAASPCTPRVPMDGRPLPSGSVGVEIPSGREGFLTWARTDPTFVLGPPTPARLGAFDAIGYELRLADACDLRGSMFESAEVFTLNQGTPGTMGTARVRWSMFRDSRTWWYLWEIDGQTMLAAVDAPDAMPEFVDAARSILTSLAPAD